MGNTQFFYTTRQRSYVEGILTRNNHFAIWEYVKSDPIKSFFSVGQIITNCQGGRKKPTYIQYNSKIYNALFRVKVGDHIVMVQKDTIGISFCIQEIIFLNHNNLKALVEAVAFNQYSKWIFGSQSLQFMFSEAMTAAKCLISNNNPCTTFYYGL